ncbi:hypothetical protein ACFSM5_16900 [Lacibacterium aquatile]|uniref:Aminoglycoside phosphotransferase domain-containing protein n=1 Tax=Lacibacterium aquatile TaxID=1168082 RepID=A0ABW5DXA6_9PROT
MAADLNHVIPEKIREILKEHYEKFVPTSYSVVSEGGGRFSTRGILVHSICNENDRCLSIVEKRLFHRPIFSGTSAEEFFYKNILNVWPSAQKYCPKILKIERSFLGSSIFMSKEGRRSVNLYRDYLKIVSIVKVMQADAPDLSCFGSFDYFSAPASRRYRGNYRQYIRKIIKGPLLTAPESFNSQKIIAMLDGMSRLCQDMPRVPSHLDLLQKNIRFKKPKFTLIDWGEFSFAPIGFEYGGLLSSLFRLGVIEDYKAIQIKFMEQFRANRLKSGSYKQDLVSLRYFYFISCLSFIYVKLNRVQDLSQQQFEILRDKAQYLMDEIQTAAGR